MDGDMDDLLASETRQVFKNATVILSMKTLPKSQTYTSSIEKSAPNYFIHLFFFFSFSSQGNISHTYNTMIFFQWEEGHLSLRMRAPGNTWQEVWNQAKAVPARRQKRLFDDTKEGEKVRTFTKYGKATRSLKLVIFLQNQ